MNSKNLNSILETWVNGKEDDLRQSLANNGYDPNGAAAKSLRSNVNIQEGNIEISITASNAWYYMEHGRGPGKMPPIGIIKEWVERKNIATENTESVAYAIAKYISMYGTEKYRNPSLQGKLIDPVFTDSSYSLLLDNIAGQLRIDLKDNLKKILNIK